MSSDMKHHNINTDVTPIYHDFEDGRYFINAPNCILSAYQIVQVGTVYLLSDKQDSGTILLLVKLLNVRFDSALVCLQLMDILTNRVFKEYQVVRPSSEDCTWMLVDMEYFINHLRMKKAQHPIVQDSLLEFDF